MAALTPARQRFHVGLPRRYPVFTSLPFPDILPPTTPTSPKTSSVSRRPGLTFVASRLRQKPAGSSFCCGRIMFTFVAVYQVLFVALRPASRRRSYFKFSPGTRFPMAEVFHLGGLWRSTAHWSAPSRCGIRGPGFHRAASHHLMNPGPRLFLFSCQPSPKSVPSP